ncbi:MAG: hypothetical protein D6725_12870 [Planctomycetota bacterium]|nr:MAG: hypothetical protein D6725_12870 [Planctomycetota bacterium]
MLRVAICGEESAGLRVFQCLRAEPVTLCLVLSGSVERPTPLASAARRVGLPAYPARCVRERDFADVLRDERVDVVLNVHSLHVVRAEVLAAARVGWFNLHPGPLPEMAGLNVPSWAIYRGHRRHAVTLHEMRPQIDTGRIVARRDFPIAERETALSLYARCIRLGVAEVVAFVRELAASPGRTYSAEEQDLSRREYFGRDVPDGGVVDAGMSSERLDRFVRACDFGPYASPWGHPRISVPGVGTLELLAGETLACARGRAAPPGTLAVHDGTVHRVSADGCFAITKARCGDRILDGGALAAALRQDGLEAVARDVSPTAVD